MKSDNNILKEADFAWLAPINRKIWITTCL